MQINLKHLIISCLLFTLVPAIAQITDYYLAKSELEENFEFMVSLTEENILGAYELVEISYKILSESLENEMQEAFVPFLSAYKEANGKVQDIDLSKLKDKFGEEYEFYIINKDGVIIQTTFTKDQNLNFAKIAPDFNKKLQSIRIKGGYHGDRVTSTIKTGEVRKFGYWGTRDKKYILEIGISSSKFNSSLKKIDLIKITKSFEEFNPDLKSVKVFNGDGKIFNDLRFIPSEDQINTVKKVFLTGERVEFMKNSLHERIIYLKADIDDQASASDGDKVIEIVFDTKGLKNKLNDIVIEQVIVTTIFTIIGSIVSLFLHRVLKF